MHKSRLAALIIDCQTDDLQEQATFWSEALGCEAEKSGTQVNDKYIRLKAKDDETQVLLQKVDHPSRVHLDIESDDIEAEAKRLQALGATIVDRLEKWTVMEAPSGHRFCIIGPMRSDFESEANTWN